MYKGNLNEKPLDFLSEFLHCSQIFNYLGKNKLLQFSIFSCCNYF